VKRRPASFDALFQAAVILQQLGRTLESIHYYRRAIRANGSVAEVHYNLGGALLELGRFDDAEQALRRALSLNPNDAKALAALGRAVAELNRPEEAAALLERSLVLEASSASTYVWLGHVLLRLERFPQACAAFAQAVELVPDSAEPRDGLGVALQGAGETDEAIASFRAALARDPTYANAACNLGQALLEIGDLSEGFRWLDRAIDLEPSNGRFYLPVVSGGPTHVTAARIEAMIRLGDAIETLPTEQRIDLHFALAQTYEWDGKIDRAFRHLLAGSALKRADISYDEAKTLAFLRSTEAAFGNPIMAHMHGCGNPSDRPVFIIGMPRSGSTLVEQMLAAHPEVVGAGEIGIMERIVPEVWPTIAASTLAELRTEIRRIGERYLRETDGLAGTAVRLVDKSLNNFQVAPLLYVTLPNARLIHVRRNALDTCFSCFSTLFRGSALPFTYDLAELGRYYRAYVRMMERWLAFVPPDRLLTISYESLVDNFEEEARRIVAFCGLPWDPACLAFHAVPRRVRTASVLQVRRPLYRDSLGRAQRFLAYLAPLTAAIHG